MNEKTKLPEGLELAIDLIESTLAGPNARASARAAIRAEHGQRLTLQQRVADLEADLDKAQLLADGTGADAYAHCCDNVEAWRRKRGHETSGPEGTLCGWVDWAIDAVDERDKLQRERDEWQRVASAYSPAKELAEALKQSRASGDAARRERNELRARLAEIEAQEPVAWQCLGCGNSEPLEDLQQRGHISCCPEREMRHLFASPVPAQVAPDADGARYRWLKSRPVAVPTVGPDLALWSDCAGDALRGDDADAEIDAAMAAAPEHKA